MFTATLQHFLSYSLFLFFSLFVLLFVILFIYLFIHLFTYFLNLFIYLFIFLRHINEISDIYGTYIVDISLYKLY